MFSPPKWPTHDESDQCAGGGGEDAGGGGGGDGGNPPAGGGDGDSWAKLHVSHCNATTAPKSGCI